MIFTEAYEKYSGMWETPFRFYHTQKNHLDPLLSKCDSIELKYFALFHDIIYDPYSTTNEENSALFFDEIKYNFEDLKEKELVTEMILATKKHESLNALVRRAIDLDMEILDSKFTDLVAYEKLIFLEYQKFPLDEYLEKRIEFLSKYKSRGCISYLIDYLRTKEFKVGVYAGSFDPFHIGHLDILRKSEKLFDKVIIVRGVNPEKPAHKFPMPKLLPNETIIHSGLITELFDRKDNYTLIRGIRNEYDIASEMNYMAWVNELNRKISFIHIFCDQNNIKISSSTLNGLSKMNGFDIEKWIVK